MPFNINSFKSEIVDSGILPSNKFEVYMSPPNILQSFNYSPIQTNSTSSYASSQSSDVMHKILMRAENVMAPGISLEVASNNRYGYGIAQRTPFNANFDLMNLTFISDGYGIIWKYYHMWLRSIFNFSGNDAADISGGQLSNASGNYLVSYKDDYSVPVSIVMYDEFGNKIQTNDYTQAFPLTLTATQFNWNLNNQYLKINVVMAFTDHSIAGLASSNIN